MHAVHTDRRLRGDEALSGQPAAIRHVKTMTVNAMRAGMIPA